MRFLVLGPVMARIEGEWKGVAAPQQRLLLGALLLHRNRVVSADRLVELVWGDDAPDGALRTLRSYISRLRDWLEPGRVAGEESVVSTESGGYVLRVDREEVDADRFELLLAEGTALLTDQRWSAASERLTEALALWRGEALEEIAFEGFARGEVVRLEEGRLVCLERRVEADLELGRHGDLVGELRAATNQHPLREGLWAQLMVPLYRCGRQADALRAFDEARRVLVEELGVEPGARLCEVQGQILRHELPNVGLKSNVNRAVRGNVPEAVSSVVGRVPAVDAVCELLERHRLVTLTGFGGVGKTTLALEVARAQRSRFVDGVWVLRLASVIDPEAVAVEVAAVLGIREDPSCPVLDLLCEKLAGREMMLIVDNCEHLIGEVVRVVGALLSGCGMVRVLATSREPLHLAGEHVWPVRPLGVPDSIALADVAESDAVTLFVERAREATGDFVLDNANVDDVVTAWRWPACCATAADSSSLKKTSTTPITASTTASHTHLTALQWTTSPERSTGPRRRRSTNDTSAGSQSHSSPGAPPADSPPPRPARQQPRRVATCRTSLGQRARGTRSGPAASITDLGHRKSGVLAGRPHVRQLGSLDGVTPTQAACLKAWCASCPSGFVVSAAIHRGHTA